MERHPSRLWTIVLAGGQGTRMARLTDAIHGRPTPKQFAALLGDRSFLQETMARATALSPPERTVVVVSASFEHLARVQLAPWGDVHLVLEPQPRGTAPGVLLPLLYVLDRDPGAHVVVLPSDHHFDRDDLFVAAVRTALDAAAAAPTAVALVGAEASDAAVDYGWIVPRGARVESFVEKPAAEEAQRLLEKGALWNTLITVGAAAALWRLCEQHLPEQTSALAAHWPWLHDDEGPARLQRLYADMKPACLCREVFERTQGLGVVALAETAGWSDCGTPERLVGCLAGRPELRQLRQRLELGGRTAADRFETGPWT